MNDEQREPFAIPQWTAESVLQQRADDLHGDKDAAIDDLRSSLRDHEILTDFGIDLGQIEG